MPLARHDEPPGHAQHEGNVMTFQFRGVMATSLQVRRAALAHVEADGVVAPVFTSTFWGLLSSRTSPPVLCWVARVTGPGPSP